MMILLCELAVKSEGISFSTTLDIKITTKLLSFLIISFLTENLTFRAQMPSSGPVFQHRGHGSNTNHLGVIVSVPNTFMSRT